MLLELNNVLSTVKSNLGGGSGSLAREHSKVMLGDNESASSRQKSMPTL